MSILIVVDNIKGWPFEIPDVQLVEGRAYLAQPEYANLKRVKLFNLCRSYKYQSIGYYVTLLATARGHRPLPDVTTIEDLKSPTMVRFVSEELDDLIQKTLHPLRSREFTLSMYFGHNTAKRFERLSMQLFNQFQTPFVRATFARPNGKWVLRSVQPISLGDIPVKHHPFVVERARGYFSGRQPVIPRKVPAKYDLAILVDPHDKEPPSNAGAIANFVQAAEEIGLRAEVIGRDDFSRLLEFDALFMRDTTHVGHYTYRFARRAFMEGLVVIDDPESILKCTNKVYLAELLEHHKVPIPRTLIVHRDNLDEVGPALGFPCVLKLPDASFSQGVVKVDDEAMMRAKVAEFLNESDLVVAQEFLPTSYDWRVGVCNRQALFACKYHMAKQHWQIIKRSRPGHYECGPVETVPIADAPAAVIETAVRAADLIGDGLYGVDLKFIDDRACVIEINDNPNIDAGNEDQILKDELYQRIMSVFLERIERKKAEFDEATSAKRS